MRWCCVALVAAAGIPHAQTPGLFGSPSHFTEQGGAAIYAAICAGCHMVDGRGAAGAGAYPSLQHAAALADADATTAIVMNGRGAMPGFAHTLSQQQVADVVAYVRMRFGDK